MLKFEQLNKFVENNKKYLFSIYIIFFVTGTVGMLTPALSSQFQKLTPLALLLSFLFLLIYHRGQYNYKSALVFIFIFIAGFAIEILGVKHGFIFGHYMYGNNLGIKIWETPVLIGMSWLILTYTTASLFENVNIHLGFKTFFAAAIMLIYDMFLEQLAPTLDMWHWKDEIIPLQNFIAWFIIAFIFQLFIKINQVSTSNSIAKLVLSCQFAFFILLFIFKSFIIT
ncbi:MAG: carotenoid biosynthesis protein [Bacteroidetes bacterium]|nr:carotenoid biosynthesis protein [Bacteroidota bacterium]